MTRQVNIAVVDDEELARKRITDLLAGKKNYTTFTCRNGFEAVETINRNDIDILFLDIQMPEVNGFEVIENISADKMPVIVFVTAYDKFALKAFEIHAIDYLLKPFDDDRFYSSLSHALDSIENNESKLLNEKVINLLNERNNTDTTQYAERVLIKSGGKIYFIKSDDIDFISAAGKYLEIHIDEEKHLIRKTMQEMESRLDPEKFLRIHRSTIINIDRVKEIQHWYKNEYMFILDSGDKFTSGNTYRKNLDKILSTI